VVLVAGSTAAAGLSPSPAAHADTGGEQYARHGHRRRLGNVTVGNGPDEMAFTPDGRFAYVADFFEGLAGTVSVIDTATRTTVATIPVGAYPAGVTVTPDGRYVYVTNWGTTTVSVISTATNTVVATVTVGNAPSDAVVTPDGSRVYVTNMYSDSMAVISTATNTVTDTIHLSTAGPVDTGPNGLAITPDGSRIYTANSFAGEASVISTLTNSVIAAVPVGAYPTDVDIASDVHTTPSGAAAGPPVHASNSSKQDADGGVTTKNRNLTGTNSGDKSREKPRHTRHVRHRPPDRPVLTGRRRGTRPPA
jgi:YVTN family beta-propeller protein